MEIIEIFAKNAEFRRKELGLTQEALAKKMASSRSTVATLLAGRTALGIDTLQKWARALEVTPGWLISEDEKPPENYDSDRLAAILAILEVSGTHLRKAIPYLNGLPKTSKENKVSSDIA